MVALYGKPILEITSSRVMPTLMRAAFQSLHTPRLDFVICQSNIATSVVRMNNVRTPYWLGMDGNVPRGCVCFEPARFIERGACHRIPYRGKKKPSDLSNGNNSRQRN